MCAQRGGVVVTADRTGEVHRGQPSGAVMTWTFLPWLACFLTTNRSTPSVGAAVRHRSVSIRVPSMEMWLCPAIFAASSADSSAGAWAARTVNPSSR